MTRKEKLASETRSVRVCSLAESLPAFVFREVWLRLNAGPGGLDGLDQADKGNETEPARRSRRFKPGRHGR